MKYLQDRLREPTTYIGIMMILSAFGITIPAEALKGLALIFGGGLITYQEPKAKAFEE